MASFCNCNPENPELFSNKFRVVEADKDGICLNCGHYTLVSNDKAYTTTSNVDRRGHNTKYSDETITEIRELLKTKMFQSEIAEKLGVSRELVSNIKTGRVKRSIAMQ